MTSIYNDIDATKGVYLQPGQFIDSNHPEVVAFAHQHTQPQQNDTEKAIALYLAIRDGFRYDPYTINLSETGMKASNLLTRNYGYCVEKANLLAACARVMGIPSRLGFANVRNHIGVEKYVQVLRTDVLVFHGYTDLYLNGQWVKATPAFNKELCARYQVEPLEFNGTEDSIFQEYTAEGAQYMEYLEDHGVFADVPRTLFIEQLKHHYPHLVDQARLNKAGIQIDF